MIYSQAAIKDSRRAQGSLLEQFPAPLLEQREALLPAELANHPRDHLRGLPADPADGEHAVDDPQAALHDVETASGHRALGRAPQLLHVALGLADGVRAQAFELDGGRVDDLPVGLGDGQFLLEALEHLVYVGLHDGFVAAVVLELLAAHQPQALRLLEGELVAAEEVEAVPVEQQRGHAPVHRALLAELRAEARHLAHQHHDRVVLAVLLQLLTDRALPLLLLRPAKLLLRRLGLLGRIEHGLLLLLPLPLLPRFFLLLLRLLLFEDWPLAREGVVELVLDIKALIDALALLFSGICPVLLRIALEGDFFDVFNQAAVDLPVDRLLLLASLRPFLFLFQLPRRLGRRRCLLLHRSRLCDWLLHVAPAALPRARPHRLRLDQLNYLRLVLNPVTFERNLLLYLILIAGLHFPRLHLPLLHLPYFPRLLELLLELGVDVLQEERPLLLELVLHDRLQVPKLLQVLPLLLDVALLELPLLLLVLPSQLLLYRLTDARRQLLAVVPEGVLAPGLAQQRPLPAALAPLHLALVLQLKILAVDEFRGHFRSREVFLGGEGEAGLAVLLELSPDGELGGGLVLQAADHAVDDQFLLDDFVQFTLPAGVAVLRELRSGSAEAEGRGGRARERLLEGLLAAHLPRLLEEPQLRAGEALVPPRRLRGRRRLAGSPRLPEAQLRLGRGPELVALPPLLVLEVGSPRGRVVSCLMPLQDLRHRTVVPAHEIKLQARSRPIAAIVRIVCYMRRLNEVVQYDFERNTFYKINKETGAESPTYRNGENVKRFRPDVTGQSYLIRRRSERAEAPPAPRLPKERSFNTERLVPEYSYFKTLETSRRESKPTEASILMRSTASKGKQLRPGVDGRESSFLQMGEGGEGGEEGSREKSSERASQALLNQTLSSYSKLLKEKPRENHSPKREQYEGSQTGRDPLDTLCTTLSHFRTREPVWETQTPPASKPERTPRPLEFSAKETSSKERSLFLEFHPELRPGVNPARLEAQVQRKRNLKILEELFIRQGNRQTRRSYQSQSTA